MNLELSAANVLAICAGLAGLLASAYTLIYRMAAIEFKVNLIWDFLMKRALAEAMEKNVIRKNSPMVVTEHVRPYFANMIDDLRAFYQTRGKSLPDRDLFIEIEKRFADRLVEEVCIPNGLSHGACIWAAMELMKAQGAE